MVPMKVFGLFLRMRHYSEVKIVIRWDDRIEIAKDLQKDPKHVVAKMINLILKTANC